MKRKIVIISISLILSSFSIAQEKTFIREYTHRVGDADSKITSRAIALNQVKKILLEEIGVYLESTFEIEKLETSKGYKELTNSQITSITAGITETKIIDEKWNGIEFYIKAEITIDANDMLNKLNKIIKDRDKTKQLIDANARADQAFIELSRIEEKLNQTVSEKEKLQLQLEYAKSSNILSAADWFQKGNNAREIKEYDNAILYYQKALELDSKASNTYYNIAIVYGQKGNVNKSIEYYKTAIEINPNEANYYNNLGCDYKEIGEYGKAKKSFQKAIELNSLVATFYDNLGTTYDYETNYNKAIDSYQKAIAIDSNYTSAYYNLGTAYASKEDYTSAIYSFQKGVKTNPKNAILYYNLGFSYQALNNLNDALIAYKKAADIDPKYADAYYNIGIIYDDMGEYDNAIKSYINVINIDKEYSSAYFNLALAYANVDKWDKAIKCLKIAARLGHQRSQEYLKSSGKSW